jgi:hypothetical protein
MGGRWSWRAARAVPIALRRSVPAATVAVRAVSACEVIEPRAARLWWTYGWPCGAARGYETRARVAWGRYVAFDVAKVTADGEVTRLDGQITPLGVRLIGAVEGA